MKLTNEAITNLSLENGCDPLEINAIIRNSFTDYVMGYQGSMSWIAYVEEVVQFENNLPRSVIDYMCQLTVSPNGTDLTR